ncbi:protein of unknown function [Taphrina deformans PYCC 5710]|uniref:Cation-transporting ATPase n=1 Tax=Taphrina deformans (strain PYCC 5710 / ATCC 11124 / CBS 356.35 / IMI 108563 / JCM 9778 / NBRC 8474) TaxID=1097556 RepID=R4XLT8_TAPDE|nr:protein of unknown function [Taphrina deformans PYCC 5710]|eukprot:CCG84260.1 protein of unknown function [Taphrina deformans PYCC 5710]
MASDSIFDGPISEGVPTSQTGFAHRTSFSHDPTGRTNSNASEGLLSLRFFKSEYDEEADEDAMSMVTDPENEEAVDDLESIAETASVASSRRPSSRRASSASSRRSLLRRRSAESNTSGFRDHTLRTSQKVYLQEEDLFLVIAGFRTSTSKLVLYYAICVLSFGIGYLILRWLPRWNIKFTGIQCSLKECDWVVIENQWHDVSVHDVIKKDYGTYLSTLFEIGNRGEDNSEEDDPMLDAIRYLDYRYVRFLWNPAQQRFVLYNNYKDPAWRGSAKECRDGLDEDAKTRRLALFGLNLIDIAEKTIPQLLVDEALHPFYIFQIASIVLWSCDEYYYYAVCIFVISLASIASTVVETKDTMKRLREMAKFSCDIRVLRNGYWQITESADLVPGDIFEISDPAINVLPCDALLMSGECVVNESMLTGESVPVAKVEANDKSLHRLANSQVTVSPELGRHYLFAGTKLIQVKKPSVTASEEEIALAMVTRTGFNTTKGALVRSMLFPKPAGFKFYRDSFRFIGVMGIIAMCGFTLSAINFVKLGMHWSLILIRALDLITIVVPPALPATLTIGTNFAINRLRKHKIFCISPNRVNVAGKIDVMCFDKTGTLTEDGLDVLGIRTITPTGFTDLLEESAALAKATSVEPNLSILHVMATCHSLRLIDNELLGDPLDDKMFKFTGWSYEEGGRKATSGPAKDLDHSAAARASATKVSPPVVRGTVPDGKDDVEIGIMKQFEFVSNLRRMSVIAKRLESSDMQVYLKGAPEIMSEVCRADSFPENYEEVLASYTHRGYRVIACAGKSLPGLSWIKAQKMKREVAEKDLIFLGFIVFENKLKPTTTAAMVQLNEARIRSVMCTGDNVLTAISVARECQLLNDTGFIFVPRFTQEGGATNPLQTIVWENMEAPSITLDNKSLMPQIGDNSINLESPFDKHGISDFCLAVTGEVFRWMVDFAPKETLHRMLVKGAVFARMSPDEKAELVEKLQSIDYCVGFCGDGANDCGALKAADVGISLSEAEASVAAPFTSRSFEISCVIQVIKDGRAALVTSFSCFKYMALYSAIQFTTVSLLYRTASNLGNFQFLLIDLALILPIAVFMGRAKPYKKLAIKRPTANLVSKKILGSLLGHIAIIVLLQALVYVLVQEQPWYVPPTHHTDEPNIVNSDNTVLFLLSLFQYAFIAIILSVGPPYRQPMYKNTLFMLTIIAVSIFTIYLTLYPANQISSLLQLTYLPWWFKAVILGLAACDIFLSWVGETFVFGHVVKAISRCRALVFGGSGKQRKTFKLVSEEMRF